MMVSVSNKPENSTFISLEAVCNINILDDKQVFNMCYTFTDKKGAISGYYYAPPNRKEYLKSKYFNKNFIKIRGVDREIYVNKKFISFVKKDFSNHSKIIFGFKHSILRHNSEEFTFAPEYMYIKVSNEEIDKIFDDIINELNRED